MRSRSGTRSSIVRIAFNPRKGKKIIPPHIERIARRIAGLLGLQHCELSILFTNDAGIARLNRRYKGKHGATDVLAFNQGEGSLLALPSQRGHAFTALHKGSPLPLGERVRVSGATATATLPLIPSPPREGRILRRSAVKTYRRGEGRTLLGDVVISWEQAERQAPLYRQSFAEELVLYLIHGVLHLLGYEDHTVKERFKMEKLQKRILRQIRSEFQL